MSNIYKIINKNKFNITLIVCVSLFFLINLYDLHYKLEQYPTINKTLVLFIVISMLLGILIMFLSRKIKIDNEKIPIIFIILASSLGICYLCLSPLFSGSDEHNHFYRIYEISDTILKTPTKNNKVGSKLPDSLRQAFIVTGADNQKIKYNSIPKMFKIKLNKKDRVQYGNEWYDDYANTALYSPITYLPCIMGFTIGKVFNFGPFFIGMIGRLFNLLCYILLGYFALKIVPKFKMFYLLILISPNMLQCATTLSADAFTNIIFLLLIAYILNINLNVKETTIKDKIIIATLSLVISLCKIVYLPVVLLTFINSNKKIKKEKIWFNILVLVISAIVSLLWIKSTNNIFEISYDKSFLQRQYIIHNLFSYFVICIRTFAVSGAEYIECLFVGTRMYHSQLPMPTIVSYAYVIVVILGLLKEKGKSINIHIRYLIVAICLVITVLIITAIYVQHTAQFNSVAAKVISGVQGRYFIPIIMLLPFAINYKCLKINENNILKIALSINLITYFYMITWFV